MDVLAPCGTGSVTEQDELLAVARHELGCCDGGVPDAYGRHRETELTDESLVTEELEQELTTQDGPDLGGLTRFAQTDQRRRVIT